MKQILIFLTVLFISNLLFSQEYRLGKVSKKEIEQSSHLLNPEAVAAILYKKNRLTYVYDKIEGFQQVREITYRIKIYKQEGFKHADFSTHLFNSGSTRESISSIKGVTYNLEGDKIIETKLKKEQVFETVLNKYLKEVKFTMPNIKSGSVIEFNFEIRSPFTLSINEIYCQYEIPLNELDVKITIPEYFNFKTNTKGYHQINLEKSTTPGVINFTTFDRTITATTSHQNEIRFLNNIYEVKSTNIPAVKSEAYVDNINNYRASFNMEIRSVQFPNQTHKSYIHTWEDVVKSIYGSDGFGNELKKKNYFEADLDKALASVANKNEKLTAVLEFCKSKIKWNGYYGYVSSDGVKDAYTKSVGNVADINISLINMLNYAGFIAKPILVSSRNHGIPLYPTREGFDYLIAGVELDGNIYLLDATDKFSTVDVLPERAINWNGRLIAMSGENQEIALTPKAHSTTTNLISYKVFSDGKIIGKRRVQLTQHFAKDFREQYIDVNKDSYLDKLENRYDGIDIQNHEVMNEMALNLPITESFDFEMADGVEKIGNTLVFSPMLFLTSTSTPFKSETREYPINFVHPLKSKSTFIISIPDGYTVENMPTSVQIMMPENMGSFKYVIQKTEVAIQLSIQYEINNATIPQTYYEYLKDFFVQKVDKENEKIVLRKL